MPYEDIYTGDIARRDGRALAQRIAQYYTRDIALRWNLILLWERNIRFLGGDQWLHFANAGGVQVLNNIPQPVRGGRYYPRPRSNRLLPAYRTLVSNLVKNLPRGRAQPRDRRDPRHINAAKVGDALLETSYELLDEARLYVRLGQWVIATGTAFKKDYIDHTPSGWTLPVEDAFEIPGADVEFLDLDEEPLTVRDLVEMAPKSSVQSAAVSPLQMVFDPYAEVFEEGDWCMESSVRSVEWANDQFVRDEPGYRKTRLKSGGGLLSPALRIYQELKRTYGTGTTSLETVDEHGVIVLEYYERPSRKFPRGRCAVATSDGEMLYAGDSPLMRGRKPDPQHWHPYTRFWYLDIPGMQWSTSPIEQAVPLQMRLNSNDAFYMGYRNRALSPYLVVGKGSGIPRNHITGTPGQVLEVNVGAGAPTVVHPAKIGDEVFRERQEIKEDIEVITGTMDILRGEKPGSVSAFSALAYLRENAQDAQGVIYQTWAKSIERSSQAQLKLYARLLEDGETRDPAFVQQVKRHLADAPDIELDIFKWSLLLDGVDLSIEPGSAAPKSFVLYQQRIMELLQTGLLTPALQSPVLREKLFRLLEVEEFASGDSDDVRKAETENAFMDIGRDANPFILENENHFLHIQVHLQPMKSVDFFKNDENVRMAYAAHIRHHMEIQARQQQEQPGQSAMDQTTQQTEAGQVLMGSRGQARPLNQALPGGEPPAAPAGANGAGVPAAGMAAA